MLEKLFIKKANFAEYTYVYPIYRRREGARHGAIQQTLAGSGCRS